MAARTIFDRLKQDHDKHRALIDAIAQTSGDSAERERLFEEFKLDATAHAAAEEETFYAAIMKQSDLREDARHSVSEHKDVAELFVELSDMDKGSSGWLNRFNTLKEKYLHHIDEEEQEKFPKAQAEMSEGEQAQLKEEFNARKPEELDRAEARTDEKELRKEMSEGN